MAVHIFLVYMYSTQYSTVHCSLHSLVVGGENLERLRVRQSVHLIGRALEDAGERLPGGLNGADDENDALLTLCTRQESLLLREYRAALANAILVPPPYSGPVSLRADSESDRVYYGSGAGGGAAHESARRPHSPSQSGPQSVSVSLSVPLMEHDYTAAAASGSGAPSVANANAEAEADEMLDDVEMRELADLKPEPAKLMRCPHDYRNAGYFNPHEEFKFLDLFKNGYEHVFYSVLVLCLTMCEYILPYVHLS